MQFILAAEMIETNARTRRKIERRRRNTRMKKEVSAKVRNFKDFDFEKFRTCKDLYLTQKTFDNLYDKLIDLSNKSLLKIMRIDFANMC